MTGPDGSWVVEVAGRRYVVAEIGAEQVVPVPMALPALVGPVVLLAPLVVGLVASVAAILQPDRVLVLITAAALLASVPAAVAASMVFGATLARRDRTPVAPILSSEARGRVELHLRSVPALERGPR